MEHIFSMHRKLTNRWCMIHENSDKSNVDCILSHCSINHLTLSLEFITVKLIIKFWRTNKQTLLQLIGWNDNFPSFCTCEIFSASTASLLFVSIPQLEVWGTPNVGWKGSVCSCFLTSVHTAIEVQCCVPVLHLHSSFRDFSNGVCHVMKI